MYFDSHLHTSFSGDADTLPEQQLDRAVALGMKMLTITDHYDPDFPPSDCDFSLDTSSYYKRLSELRHQYQDKIDLGIGVELGLQPHLTRELPFLAKEQPYDFIIGSTHVSRGIDPYEREQFIAGTTEDAAYLTYFEEELQNLKLFDCYDVAGHLDYVVRYGPNRNQFYTWERYGEVLDEILRTVIAKGKGIECNTAGWKAELGYPHPMPQVLRRYRELGGEIITLGSDAHSTEYVGYRFDEAGELLKSLGFRYYTVFRKREPQFLPL